MTKNSLIKQLQKIKSNPIICMSVDSEGNSFSALYQISPDYFYDREERSILDKQEIEEYGRENVNYKKCIVLWPS